MTDDLSKIRVGQGFDVHAFDHDTPSSTIRLGGIDVPHNKSLKGHSDADVVLHALTDAILGAIGKGDIGEHFPPSDPTFKGMDSTVFLDKALSMVDMYINNIDLTIICEEPKIGLHKVTLRQNIASLCDISENQVNIKATTTEGLGFTGRKEGMACMATVLVTLK